MLLGTVKGQRLQKGLFLPELVPDVWSRSEIRNCVKIYLLSRKQEKLYSYFLPRDERNAQRFVDEGYAFVDKWQDADIIVSDRLDWLRNFIRTTKKWLGRRVILLHTHEPSRYREAEGQLTIDGVKVHAMGCFTGDVWMNNIQYFPVEERIRTQEHRIVPVPRLDLIENKTALRRKVVIVASFGKKLDDRSVIGNLSAMRTQIALFGFRWRVIDVFGGGWPRNVSRGDTRNHGRVGKLKILSNYDFCLCFENTSTPYYVTEKIWEAIMGGCLPIYYGGSWIYDTFPHNSFIDYAEIKTSEKLFQLVMNMTAEEWVHRMNLCISTFNKQLDVAYRKFDDLYDSLFARLRTLSMQSKQYGQPTCPVERVVEVITPNSNWDPNSVSGEELASQRQGIVKKKVA